MFLDSFVPIAVVIEGTLRRPEKAGTPVMRGGRRWLPVTPPAAMGDTSEVFRGFVFTHRNLLPSVWKALRDHRLPAAGATAWEDPSARCPRKRARGGSAGLAPPGAPTHVILTDRADADTRALAARQYPAAILVTQTWVFDRLAGKPEAPPPESSPPPTSAPSANPTSRLPLAAPASDDDVLPPDHPNWILDARVSNRAFDASDGVRLGARVGATMDSVERCLRCRLRPQRVAQRTTSSPFSSSSSGTNTSAAGPRRSVRTTSTPPRRATGDSTRNNRRTRGRRRRRARGRVDSNRAIPRRRFAPYRSWARPSRRRYRRCSRRERAKSSRGSERARRAAESCDITTGACVSGTRARESGTDAARGGKLERTRLGRTPPAPSRSHPRPSSSPGPRRTRPSSSPTRLGVASPERWTKPPRTRPFASSPASAAKPRVV